MTGVSVIVTTYNNDAIRLCVEGFARQKDPPPFEICLVNDGGDTLELEHPLVRHFYLDPPSPAFRLAQARNLGARHARFDRLVFTDEDCVPAPDMVRRHGGHREPFVIGFRRRVKVLGGPFIEDDRLADLNLPDPLKIIRLAFGCNIGIDTAVFRKLGGFDERYVGWGFEDLDLAARVYEQHYCMVFDRDIITYHIDHPLRSNYHPELTALNRSRYLAILERACQAQPL